MGERDSGIGREKGEIESRRGSEQEMERGGMGGRKCVRA